MILKVMWFFFFQAEDGIRDRSPSRGLGDVYKRQIIGVIIAVMKETEDYFGQACCLR